MKFCYYEHMKKRRPLPESLWLHIGRAKAQRGQRGGEMRRKYERQKVGEEVDCVRLPSREETAF